MDKIPTEPLRDSMVIVVSVPLIVGPSAKLHNRPARRIAYVWCEQVLFVVFVQRDENQEISPKTKNKNKTLQLVIVEKKDIEKKRHKDRREIGFRSTVDDNNSPARVKFERARNTWLDETSFQSIRPHRRRHRRTSIRIIEQKKIKFLFVATSVKAYSTQPE